MILDTLAAMISGSQLPPGKFALGFARGYQGDKVQRSRPPISLRSHRSGPRERDARPFGRDRRYPSALAIASGLLGGALGAGRGRESAPAANASARGCARPRCRPARHRNTSQVAIYGGDASQHHAISGTFGSAASAACMAGLSAQQMRWLLSYTSQSASGLASWQRDTQHIEKSFDFGGMPRATASPPRFSSKPAGRRSTTSSPAPTIFSRRSSR